MRMAKSKRSRRSIKKTTRRKGRVKLGLARPALLRLRNKATSRMKAPVQRIVAKGRPANKKKRAPKAIFSWADSEEE